MKYEKETDESEVEESEVGVRTGVWPKLKITLLVVGVLLLLGQSYFVAKLYVQSLEERPIIEGLYSGQYPLTETPDGQKVPYSQVLLELVQNTAPGIEVERTVYCPTDPADKKCYLKFWVAVQAKLNDLEAKIEALEAQP